MIEQDLNSHIKTYGYNTLELRNAFRNIILSKEFLNKHKHYLPWYIITKTNNFDYGTIKEYSEFVDWNVISVSYKLTIEFLKAYSNRINWGLFWEANKEITTEIIDELSEYVDWQIVTRRFKLSEEEIHKFDSLYKFDEIMWRNISKYNGLSLEFIEEYKDKLKWSILIEYTKFDEANIAKYIDYIDVSQLETSVVLTESFLDTYKDKAPWKFVCRYYDEITEEFIQKYWDYIDWDVLTCRRLSDDIFLKYFFKLDLSRIFRMNMFKDDILKRLVNKEHRAKFIAGLNEMLDNNYER